MAERTDDGRPLAPAIVREAAAWSARLWSGEATEDERRDCERWRRRHPDHELAWQRIARLAARLQALPAELAAPALRRCGHRLSRRALLTLALGVTAASPWWLPAAGPAWRLARADLRTGTGEMRRVSLPDGGELYLDSGSAVNLDYGAQARRIVLLDGRILVRTAAGDSRPFLVSTRDGEAIAHGTRYTVALAGGYTDVQVLQGAVELRPATGRPYRLLQAGQAGRYDARGLRAGGPARAREPDWPGGILSAEAMPLADFLDELSRYRPGVLRWDEALDGLRVSGVFSLRDTDAALRALADALPLRVARYTRWWTVVGPR
ncbi:FecR domain-containing protein [Bordetella hinzii]|uniref:Sigma factor regulatory protein, FecR/PupR family n=3 Tax=Bordetella hinzii TaxID=103855 RepID=A0ABR4R1A9_9BORD|nr:FecR domain-containing protein [Bordetella hinzii]KCB24148.1 sigma factor regulatory protein, FecR/PupR family [Bordetella hinzii OH87 BAL007II]QDJ43645.1 hypothetical protein CBR70_21375 [Bordetella hinzii]QDJ48217.1 hypothetical protein CBR71_21640 [Bordetella hinzii]QDJ57104.1 hypothetical protein CBR72_20935 [Bordetella hinzii]